MSFRSLCYVMSVIPWSKEKRNKVYYFCLFPSRLYTVYSSRKTHLLYIFHYYSFTCINTVYPSHYTVLLHFILSILCPYFKLCWLQRRRRKGYPFCEHWLLCHFLRGGERDSVHSSLISLILASFSILHRF